MFSEGPKSLIAGFLVVYVSYVTVLWLSAFSYHSSLHEVILGRLKNEFLIGQLTDTNLRLEQMAYFDPLTGLANCRSFQELAEMAFERVRRHGGGLALMSIDLDDFENEGLVLN